MSDQGNERQLNENTRIARQSASTAAKAGIKAGKAGAKAGKMVWRVLPPKARIILLVIIAVICLISVLVQGTSSSSFRRTYRVNALNESNRYNEANTEDERHDSIYEKLTAIEDTLSLVGVIEEAKKDDEQYTEDVAKARIRSVAGQFQRSGTQIDIDLSYDLAKKEAAESSNYYYGNGDALNNGVNSTVEILMVDNDPDNERVATRFGKLGAHVTTVYDLDDVDASKFDALIIPGGNNITPSLYGASRSRHTSGTDIDKDKLQIKAVERFAEAKKPVLGICRGCQIINVAFGGTINQGNGRYHKGWKDVKISRNSIFYETFGNKVNAYHFHKQRIKDLGTGLKATQWAKDDSDIIEGIEHESLPIYGLQWHCDEVNMLKDGEKACLAFIKVVRKNKGISEMPSGSGDPAYTSASPAVQGAINWAITIANDDSFCYGTVGPTNAPGCYFCGTNHGPNKYNKPKGYEKTYVCITFVTAAFAHGANDPEMLKLCKRGGTLTETESNLTKYSCWQKVGSFSNLSMSDLQPGDVFIDYSATTGMDGHGCIYLGGDDLVEASGGGWSKNSIGIKKGVAARRFRQYSGDSRNYVMRYVGPGDGNGQGGAAMYPKQDYPTVLKKITSSSGKTLSASDINYVSQAMAYKDGNYFVQRITPGRNGLHGYIESYTADGELSKTSGFLNIYHGNGLTYCKKDGMLYSVTCLGRGDNTKAQVIDPDTLEHKETITLPCGTSGIAYDEKTGYWVLSSGDHIRIFDSDMKEKKGAKDITKKRWETAQDIAAYDGIIMVCIDHSGTGIIDLYNELTGDYLGTFETEGLGEIESADVNGFGNLVILFNASTDFILETDIRISSTSGLNNGNMGVSKLDMDILSAYNLTLSNSSLYLDPEKADRRQRSVLDWFLDRDAYTNINGDKISIYWRGKNRGLINYEKDLKKKITDGLFRRRSDEQRFYTVAVGTTPEKATTTDENGNVIEVNILPVTIKEADVEDLLEPVFGLDPKEGYTNSKAIRKKTYERDRNGRIKTDRNGRPKLKDYLAGKATASNLQAVYSLSDETGRLLFGDLQEGKAQGAAGYGFFPGGVLNFPLDRDAASYKGVTSEFGQRWGRLHAGIDFGADGGTPIYAAHSGTVTRSAWYSGYGNCCDITSDTDPSLMTRYGHMNSLPVVNEGDYVTAGQLIGYVGSTGFSTGNHLHFEVQINGEPKNPRPYLGIQ